VAAITLIVVAIFFLPKFLSSGIYKMPEFPEYRYNSSTRSIMAFYTMVIYVGVTISAVLYSSSITINTIFNVDLTTAIWAVGVTFVISNTQWITSITLPMPNINTAKVSPH
jgi:SSS family solute:Na+ symporter